MDFQQKKLEKELQELKKLIDVHFVQRKKDEEELQALENRIEKRKESRAAQLAERARREQEKEARLQAEKERREQEAQRRADEEAARKKELLHALNAAAHGNQRQDKRKGRGTERDKKKKILAERRKQLNIDHLDIEKLKSKAKELFDHLNTLENARLTLEKETTDGKYELALCRYRVNTLNDASTKATSKARTRVGKLR
ncbi:unnamed protein product [Oikopleura dioica]|uniref:Uncharacterized protein n=1 Tax=Oikopleura dioica TaxID=34765 RepID=E4XXS8_OIKDI|nr:unnamed protein product [Oikopleura dioica]